MTEELEAFARQARQFVNWCTDRSDGDVPAQELLRQLVDLYRVAIDLPECPEAPEDSDEPEPIQISFQNARFPFDFYWEVFDPMIKEKGEPVAASLLDDVMDILRDLCQGLSQWDAGRQDAAHWEWQFGFATHWSEHASGAIRALDRFARTG